MADKHIKPVEMGEDDAIITRQVANRGSEGPTGSQPMGGPIKSFSSTNKRHLTLRPIRAARHSNPLSSPA
ncbi:hypothetical protein NQZ68_028433 [Dissostichus eleginoides]|nr:hypothetical protein NQZ68_028433 [Dissostichus eleginoides]